MKTPGKPSSTKPDDLLLKAAEEGDLKTVKERIAAGANLNAAAKRKPPAIFYAIRSGKLPVLHALIEAGANLNSIAEPPGSSIPSTPLCHAIESKNREMAEALLKAGADLTLDAKPGINPASNAAEQASRAYFTLNATEEQWMSSKPRTKAVLNQAKADRDYWMSLIRDSIARAVKVRDYWLWNAAKYYDQELALLLISAGVNPNAAPHGGTALAAAIELGLEEMALALIKAGADVNLKAKNPPLLVAAANGRVSIIPALLDAGADINVVDDIQIDEPEDPPKPKDPYRFLPTAEGVTALIVATRMGNEAAVKLLVERGADVNIGDKHGITALAWATRKNAAAIMEIVSKTGAAKPEFLEGSLSTAFWLAAKAGNKAKIEQLLSRGAKPDEMVKDLEGEHFALVSAAREGHLDVVQLLLQHGTNVNIRAQENWSADVTPLMAAARKGHTEIVKALLAAKADVAAKDKGLDGGGETPLHYAARGGNADVVRALIGAGAKANAKAKDGITPLCLAVSEKKHDAIKALLEGGADANAGPSDGSGPLYIATSKKDPEAVRMLLDHSALPLPKGVKLAFIPLDTAASNGSVEIVGMLLKAGAPVSAQTHRGDTALAGAALRGHLEVVKILLAAGAEPNLADADGFTPLMAALRSKKEDVVELLLDAGADITAVQKDGGNALKIAREGKNEKIISLIEAAAKKQAEAKPSTTKSAPKPKPAKEVEDEDDLEDDEDEEFEAPDFSGPSKSAEFQTALQEVEKLSGSKPQPLSDIKGGYSFGMSRAEAERLLASHQRELLKKGALLFRHNRSDGHGEDKLGLLPTRDWTDLIRVFQTNGANFDLMPADIAKWMTKLSEEQPFIITGASWDWLEGRFTTEIMNPRKLAHKLYEFCPDIVDQGAGTVKDLARLLEKDGYFFLWWD